MSWAETPGLLDTPVSEAVCALVVAHGRVQVTHGRVVLVQIFYFLFFFFFFFF